MMATLLNVAEIVHFINDQRYAFSNRMTARTSTGVLYAYSKLAQLSEIRRIMS